jgi:hypothetical protein
LWVGVFYLWADFNQPNKVDPKVNQRYIRWQEDREWTNYTIQVNKPVKHRIIMVYGYQDNRFELLLNNAFACKLILPQNIGDWHKWTQATVGRSCFLIQARNY